MKWSSTKGWITPIVVVVIMCGVVGVVATRGRTSSTQTSPTYTKPLTTAAASQSELTDAGTSLDGRVVPNFTLMNQFGKSVSLSQFRGKVVVLAFVDSECTTICPLTTADMMNAVQMLGGKAQKQIALVGIDANPQATTVSDVMTYSKEHNMVNSWDFLTGNLAQLQQVWKGFNIDSQIVNGQIDHTPALYVIDPQGKERVLYMTPSQYSSVDAETAILASDIKKYLPVKDAKAVKPVQAQPITWAPNDTATLPAVQDGAIHGTVTLGDGKPTLVAFFSSWAPNAKVGIEQLSQFAKEPGSPDVVGVDVATTEPSQGWFLNWSKQLGSTGIPIGIDQTGKIADGFKVTDLMWLSLVNANGKVIWSNDGWLPIRQLKAIVNSKIGLTPISS